MSIPDGEYPIDINILNGSSDETLGLRHGVLPSDLDPNKPMKLYDDSKNIILQANSDGDEQMIFEGLSQVHTSKNPLMANYYLSFEDDQFKLGKLNRTIRVNKSRNSIKWGKLIRKWNNELESKNIISESDFEDLNGFSMDFEERDLDLDDVLVKRQEEERQIEATKALVDQKETSRTEQKAGPSEVSASKASETIKALPLKTPVPTKAPPTQTEALVPQLAETKRVAGKRPSKTASKSVGNKRVTKRASPPPEDDFDDLENQLEEVLESDSSEDSYVGFSGGPIQIIDSQVTNKKSVAGQTKTQKPMSLRQFMGDNNDNNDDMNLSVSEEE